MAKKMDKTVVIVCAVVGSLGMLSAILGFSAEGSKLTPSDVLVIRGECLYPQNPAFALGVCAAFFLLMAQITVSAVGGCCGCCKSRASPSGTKRIVGVVCAVISWIAAVIAWARFVEGVLWNAHVARETVPRATVPECYVLKDGIFASASVLTLAATALGIASFIMLRRQPDATGHPQFPPQGEQQPPAGIAMGHPQFPPPQGYGQAPSHPQYSPPKGYAEQAPNAQFPPPPPAQGYGSQWHAPNQQFPPQGHAQV